MKILSELTKDASISIPQLSKKLSINSSVLYSRIKRLMKRELIKKFTVIINESENNAAMQLQTNSSANKNMVDCYTTSATQNMAHSIVTGNNIAITPMSVTNLVMKYE